MKEDFRHFFEDKNRLIDKLDLTDDQKEELKAFFQKHPNYENKIDWNNKSLQYKDFESVLSLEGSSENSKKKYGLSGKAQIEDLVEGKDYLIIAEKDEKYYHTVIYYPLTFKASEVLAKPTTPPLGITGKWCIAGRNYSPGTRDQHWNQYTNDGTDFFFVFSTANEGQVWYKQNMEVKFAISRTIDNEFNYFDSDDNEIEEEDNDFGYDEDGNWYEDRDENDSGLDPDLEWAKEVIDKQQPKHIFAEHRFYIDEKGIRFSKDRKSLQRCPADLTGTYRIPEGTERIMAGAFAETKLSRIEIPGFIKEIDSGTFYNAHKLTEIIIEDGVEKIGSRAFKGCAWLREISLPDSITEIKDAAFINCHALEKVKLPANLKELYADFFARCYSLREIILPKDLERIWGEAFLGCRGLTKLTLPPAVQFIKKNSFEESGLTELEMTANPEGVTQGFWRSPLKKIIYHGTEEQARKQFNWFFDEDQKKIESDMFGVSSFALWGCELYCTEDNKTFVYTRPPKSDQRIS